MCVSSRFLFALSQSSVLKERSMFRRIQTLRGMQTFTLIWFGQLVSLLGTAMTRFALLIWAYQQTGEATTLALLGFFAFGPLVLVSPFAGVLVDRWDRRKVMMLTDFGAGMMTVGMLLLYVTGNLQIWHLYVAEALTGIFEAFQSPAYTAATTVLVPKEHYRRASGMRSLASSLAEVGAPFFAGLLLRGVGITGVMVIDVATFLIAMLTLLLTRIPRPAVTAEGEAAKGSMWSEMGFGFRYIFQRPGLLGLLLIFVGFNLFAGLTYFSILNPMILARTGGDELALASVQSALGIGGVVGGVLVSIWGGPKRRIHSILGGAAISFLLGDFMLAVGRSVEAWMLAGFLAAIFIPFITGNERAIWQSKIAPDVQGRVFAASSMLRMATFPLGFLLAGPLADRIFEPAMAVGGNLAPVFGGLVGTGPGAGMGLMFVCTCIGGTTIGLLGYLIRAVRQVEDDIPDYEPDVVKLPVAASATISQATL
jgi:MFS transporter, DHA3 family, macrolide efflux protein